MKKIPSAFSREIQNALNRLKIRSSTTFTFRGETFGISECLDVSKTPERFIYYVLTKGSDTLYPRVKSAKFFELNEDSIKLAMIELTMGE